MSIVPGLNCKFNWGNDSVSSGSSNAPTFTSLPAMVESISFGQGLDFSMDCEIGESWRYEDVQEGVLNGLSTFTNDTLLSPRSCSTTCAPFSISNISDLTTEHQGKIDSIRSMSLSTPLKSVSGLPSTASSTPATTSVSGDSSSSSSVDGRSHQWIPLLHLSARENRERMVEILLSQGCDVDERDESGRTALHIASSQGHVSVMKTLLQNNAAKDACDMRGWTPMHYAIKNGSEDAFVLLVSSRAHITQHA
ncbi:hypothetical protein FH972_024726 [Carpinus fangiana]|nr:hypothetical protein FH972_024726 [Carpinus fangiana]